MTVALAADRAQFASSRAVLASLRRPAGAADGGTLADATSLTAAMACRPLCVSALAAVGLTLVYSMRSNPPASTKSSRPVLQPRTESRTKGVGRSR